MGVFQTCQTYNALSQKNLSKYNLQNSIWFLAVQNPCTLLKITLLYSCNEAFMCQLCLYVKKYTLQFVRNFRLFSLCLWLEAFPCSKLWVYGIGTRSCIYSPPLQCTIRNWTLWMTGPRDLFQYLASCQKCHFPASFRIKYRLSKHAEHFGIQFISHLRTIYIYSYFN
jgi:hypothetical protein